MERSAFGFHNPNHAAALACAIVPLCWGWMRCVWLGRLLSVLLWFFWSPFVRRRRVEMHIEDITSQVVEWSKLPRNLIWRMCVNTLSIVALVVPLAMSLYCAWELSRYIAVMGVTSDRIQGVRWVILLIFTPVFCMVKCLAGQMTLKMRIWMAMACLFAACAAFFVIDAAACRAVASHPRPRICYPNRVYVPDVPETSTSYGLTELLFRVRQKGIK